MSTNFQNYVTVEVTYMRKECEKILKELFYNELIKTRNEQNLTQEDMAQLLMMDVRSYIELDHGCSCCGAVTLCQFLCFCHKNPVEFINNYKISVERQIGNVA